MAAPVRILVEAEIRSLIGPAEALREVRVTFGRLGNGEATLPGVIGLDLPGGGEVHVKAAHLLGIQDAAVATFVAEKAARRGLGLTIEA